MYLTVKEASDLTGKSATTIYRLCNKRKNSLYIKKEDNKFFVDKEFLLATYPPEEKRISEEIEHGSVEITEPVFLEIEPKKTEEISAPVVKEQTTEVVETNDVKPLEMVVPENRLTPEVVETNVVKPLEMVASNIKATPEEKTNVNEIIHEKPIVIENLAQVNKPASNKSEILERYIGVSVSILALIALLFLFCFFSK
jgi:hypothetical protein